MYNLACNQDHSILHQLEINFNQIYFLFVLILVKIDNPIWINDSPSTKKDESGIR